VIEVKVKAICPVPRYVSSASLWQIQQSLRAIGLTLEIAQGVFWHECMERDYENAIKDGFEWILSIDSDSMFNPAQVMHLMKCFAGNVQMDALTCLQIGRGKKHPLAWKKTEAGDYIEYVESEVPFQVDEAHFGLTLLKCSRIASLPKPWFKATPNKQGTWREGLIHADIHFWRQWREADHSLYVHPQVKIGHLEDLVTLLDDDNQYAVMSIEEWREHADNFAKSHGYSVNRQE
jgi:hypothetical protein